MRRIFLTLGAATMLIPTGSVLAKPQATYHGKAVVKRCRHSAGTTGLIAGGVAGAVIGSKVIGGGVAGPLIGAAGGALAGRAIDRTITAKKRCTYESQ